MLISTPTMNSRRMFLCNQPERMLFFLQKQSFFITLLFPLHFPFSVHMTNGNFSVSFQTLHELLHHLWFESKVSFVFTTLFSTFTQLLFATCHLQKLLYRTARSPLKHRTNKSCPALYSPGHRNDIFKDEYSAPHTRVMRHFVRR